MNKSIALFILLWALTTGVNARTSTTIHGFGEDSTQFIQALVRDAATLVGIKGESAFAEFRKQGSRWRTGETYIFVLEPTGFMVVHPDPQLEGTNQLELRDVNGKPIIRGLIGVVSDVADKTTGWYHYQWPVPGGLIPRWKSSFVESITSPAGKEYIVGCGNYTDRMERDFVVDIVNHAAGQVMNRGAAAYPMFYDASGPFLAKDAYVFVIDPQGKELVNPAFPNLEGRNLMDVTDASGEFMVREMLRVVESQGSGWVDYMWPKPGDNVSTQKSAYVMKVPVTNDWVLVGCGVYLADAPRSQDRLSTKDAPELIRLVRDAASLMEKEGAQAYTAFRQPDSKWMHGDTYIFVWGMDGTRVFHGANPAIEGEYVADLKDNLGRPFGAMFLETASSPEGEGWVHYLYPEPGSLFPTWKSTFIKSASFPDGEPYLVGCGIYNMRMDKAFIEDVVNRASDLVARKGMDAFAQLRDKTGPYRFMDTYVFVDDENGVEWVNPAYPSLEGKNLINERDQKGKLAVREYIEAARKHGQAWVDYNWYKPGTNDVAIKHTYVRMVKADGQTFIVGAGYFDPE